jgi:hypothetical protein
MHSDPARIPIYVAASAIVLTLVIALVVSFRAARRPPWIKAFATAAVISLAGIVFAKYGAVSGLPWQVYYTVPALVTVCLPPFLFHMQLVRAGVYALLAFATAPLIHAAFFYGLGWPDYMPFLHLPRS